MITPDNRPSRESSRERATASDAGLREELQSIHEVILDREQRGFQTGDFPHQSLADLEQIGIFGLVQDASVGGLGGRPFYDSYAVIRELGRASTSLGVIMGHHLALATLLGAAIEELPLADELLYAAANGTLLITTSAEAGGDGITAPGVRAVRVGDSIRFTGEKIFATGAAAVQERAVIDFVSLRLAETCGDVRAVAAVQLDALGTKCEFINEPKTHGLRTSQSGTLIFREAEVPSASIIGTGALNAWDRDNYRATSVLLCHLMGAYTGAAAKAVEIASGGEGTDPIEVNRARSSLSEAEDYVLRLLSETDGALSFAQFPESEWRSHFATVQLVKLTVSELLGNAVDASLNAFGPRAYLETDPHSQTGILRRIASDVEALRHMVLPSMKAREFVKLTSRHERM